MADAPFAFHRQMHEYYYTRISRANSGVVASIIDRKHFRLIYLVSNSQHVIVDRHVVRRLPTAPPKQ